MSIDDLRRDRWEMAAFCNLRSSVADNFFLHDDRSPVSAMPLQINIIFIVGGSISHFFNRWSFTCLHS